MKTIALLNGPNLNRLGKRQPEIYGSATLADVIAGLRQLSAEQGWVIDDFQSNHEGELIDRIHAWADQGIERGIINPGGLTHTSVALRDAISSTRIEFVEVHISHIHRREEFRHRSLTAGVCVAQLSGLGIYGYEAALRFLMARSTE